MPAAFTVLYTHSFPMGLMQRFPDRDPRPHLGIGDHIEFYDERIACSLERLHELKTSHALSEYILGEFGVRATGAAVALLRNTPYNADPRLREAGALMNELRDESCHVAQLAVYATSLNAALTSRERRDNSVISDLTGMLRQGRYEDRAWAALALRGICSEQLMDIYAEYVRLYSKAEEDRASSLAALGVAGLLSMRLTGGSLESRALRILKDLSGSERVSQEVRAFIGDRLRWNVGARDLENLVLNQFVRESCSVQGGERVFQQPVDTDKRFVLALKVACEFLSRYGLDGCEAAGRLVRSARASIAGDGETGHPGISVRERLDYISDSSLSWEVRFTQALLLYHHKNPELFVSLLGDADRDARVFGALMLWGRREVQVSDALSAFLRDDFVPWEGKLMAMFVLSHNDEKQGREVLREIHRMQPEVSRELKCALVYGGEFGAPEEAFVNLQNVGLCW